MFEKIRFDRDQRGTRVENEAGIGPTGDFAPSIGDGVIHVVRIDPAKAELKTILASEHDRKPRTAAEWCSKFNLIVAINAGMYQSDHLTNVGYLKNGTHAHNSRWNRTYKSALAFKPKKEGLPAAVLIDLDEPGSENKLEGYRTVIQNLRLMRGAELTYGVKQTGSGVRQLSALTTRDVFYHRSSLAVSFHFTGVPAVMCNPPGYF